MIEDYLLDSYTSYSVSMSEDWINLDGIANFIVNLFYGLCKFLWSIFDLIIRSISHSNVFHEQVGGTFDIAKQLHDLLYGGFGVLFITITVFFIFVHYLLQHRVKAQALTLLFVFSVNAVMFTHGQRLLTSLQELSVQVESHVSSIASKTMLHSTIDEELLEKVPEKAEIEAEMAKEEAKTKTDRLREQLYFQMVQQPFALLNFGQYEFDKVVMSSFLIPADTPADQLRRAQDDIYEDVNKNKTEGVTHVYMTSYKTTEKIFMSLFILLNGIAVGGVMSVISIVFMIIQLVVLGLVLLLPIVLVLSLLPWFSHALGKALAKLLSLFGVTILVTVVSALVFFFLNVIDRVGVSIMGVGAMTYFANFMIKILFVYVVVKYHQQLITFVTGGVIRSKVSMRNFKGVQKVFHDAKRSITQLPVWNQKKHDKSSSNDDSGVGGVDSIQEAFQGSNGFSKRKAPANTGKRFSLKRTQPVRDTETSVKDSTRKQTTTPAPRKRSSIRTIQEKVTQWKEEKKEKERLQAPTRKPSSPQTKTTVRRPRSPKRTFERVFEPQTTKESQVDKNERKQELQAKLDELRNPKGKLPF